MVSKAPAVVGKLVDDGLTRHEGVLISIDRDVPAKIAGVATEVGRVEEPASGCIELRYIAIAASRMAGESVDGQTARVIVTSYISLTESVYCDPLTAVGGVDAVLSEERRVEERISRRVQLGDECVRESFEGFLICAGCVSESQMISSIQ